MSGKVCRPGQEAHRSTLIWKTAHFNMNLDNALGRVRVVLSRTSHPGNIGAAARAMKTMGLTQLVLVSPLSFPDPVATARAAGADDILAGARVVDTLAEALEGTVFAAAMTARRREMAVPMKWAREAAGELVSLTGHGDVALVFGNETKGLSNDDVALCHMPVKVPVSETYSAFTKSSAKRKSSNFSSSSSVLASPREPLMIKASTPASSCA